MGTLTELSLFTGYGGFTLGLRLAGIETKTVGYVEIDPYCQKIIQQRIKDGFLDYAPIIRDIRTDFRPMAGLVDIVTAGFPCQPHSTAGKRLGEADERNLWPDTLRLIRDVGPRFVLLENVPGILANGYGGTVVGQLSEIGYDCVWGLVSAASVGAPHLRWRWWCLAYTQSNSERRLHRESIEHSTKASHQPLGYVAPMGESISDSTDNGRTGRGRPTQQECQHEKVGRGELFGADGQDGDVADAKQSRGQSRKIHRGNELSTLSRRTADTLGTSGADVADTTEQFLRTSPESRRASTPQPRDDGERGELGNAPVADTSNKSTSETSKTIGTLGSEGDTWDDASGSSGERESRVGWWAVEPGLGRVADGPAHRVDRLKAIGNGIVPAVVAEFLKERS
jgi:DNA (cytosine-5)-methyltransferase 1